VTALFESLVRSLHPSVLVPAVAFLEGCGVPIPGSIVIAGIGVATAATLGWPSLAPLVLLYGAAYSLGALAQYTAGQLMGPKLLGWLPEARRNKLTDAVARYGASAVFWTRPLAIGNYISAPMGMIGMSRLRFMLYTFAGITPAALWTLAAGRFVGDNLGDISSLGARYAVSVLTWLRM
jgi:membrane protein DedA with SNARE-associated domain